GLRKTGSCERAAVLYLKSRALFPSVANTLNAAVCLAKVEREDEALELYQELVGRMRDQLQADELAAIGPEMQRLRSLLGTVDVAGDVGATLVIDGRSRGTLPLAGPIPIRPGAHDVRVLKEGFEVWSTAVDAKVGQVTALRATLKPLGASGRLVVTGPTGGELLVDGAPLGQLPFDGVLGPGPHVVQVVAGDSGSALQPIVVAAGQRTALSPPIGPLGGRLELVTEPHTAALIIDGVAVWSGRWRGRLPVGKQRIEAEEEGYHRAVQELVVDVTDEARRITLTLERDESHPRWAAAAPSGAFFVEALGGPALAPSLGSSAEATCSEVACEAGVPLGYTFGLRGGYELPIRLSFELEGGFFAMNRSLSRSTPLTVPTGADPLAVIYTFDDALRLRGGFVMGGVGYRLPVAGPFAVRAHALLGLMFLRARDAATGT
ncbi:MAG: PEGA domain-containing protein, partial [Myxococcales bacterium]|nr:PEGA domain-containing protein [Myxococcales bacterium]